MAVDMFLKLKGIDGESTDKKHKGEIDVISFAWGASQPGGTHGTGGRGAGKVQMQDFSFVMRANKASPKLMLACATGEHIPEAVFVCRKAGGEQQEYLTVKFTDVLISSYQTGGSEGDDVPMDQCSLNFDKIEYEYKPQKPDGTLDSPIKTGYNLKENVKV